MRLTVGQSGRDPSIESQKEIRANECFPILFLFPLNSVKTIGTFNNIPNTLFRNLVHVFGSEYGTRRSPIHRSALLSCKTFPPLKIRTGGVENTQFVVGTQRVLEIFFPRI